MFKFESKKLRDVIGVNQAKITPDGSYSWLEPNFAGPTDGPADHCATVVPAGYALLGRQKGDDLLTVGALAIGC